MHARVFHGLFWLSLTVPAIAKEPKELVELRKIQLEMQARATASLRAKHQELLKRMADDYTKAGKLEDALIAKRDAVAVWASGMWYVHKNGKPAEWLSIYPDGTACTGSIVPGHWTLTETGLIIKWDNGFTWTMTTPTEPDTLSGKDSAGVNLRYTRTKPE